MRGPDRENHAPQHVSVRLDGHLVEYIDSLGEAWGLTKDDGDVNRSEVLRTIIKTHNGVLFGNFFGIVNNDDLAEEWGDTGHLLAASNEAGRGVPDTMQDARLADVLEPVPLLVSAAEVELNDVNGHDPE